MKPLLPSASHRLGKMSPYPVVVMVVKAKYMLTRYRENELLLSGQSEDVSSEQ